MAQGNPYARIVNSMRRQGAHENGYSMELGVVTGRDPLCIQIGEEPVMEGLYCNALTASSTETDEWLEELLGSETQISDGLKQYLKDCYKAVRLDVGDKVLVQRVGNAFYLCGKVEAVV